MFSSGFFRVGAPITGTDPQEERDPPPGPTPVNFPVYGSFDVTAWDGPASLPNFEALFARVSKPADISQTHGDALNIEICPPCSLDELVPLGPDGSSYFPPLEPEQDDNAASYADAAKVDRHVAQQRRDLDTRLSELRLDNDTVFRILNRSLKDGTKAPRLAYMRKFFEGLEHMSQYWDCSLDHYYEVPRAAEQDEQGTKRQRLDPEQTGESSADPSASISEQADADRREFQVPLGPRKDGQAPAEENTATEPSATESKEPQRISSHNATPEAHSQLRYKGRRTNTGRELPDQIRADAVRAFVEGTVWPFQCSILPPRMMPSVQFSRLNLPVRQSAAVYRQPKDRIMARQGRLEGPVVAVQARNDTEFLGADGQPLEAKARLDLMRELGGLIQLMQERCREGKTEVKPGEGKWWTTKARWGGGPGGEVENEAGNSDVVQGAEDPLGGAKGEKVKREKDGSRSRKKKSPALLWKELKCGSGRWDPVGYLNPAIERGPIIIDEHIEDQLQGYWQESIMPIRRSMFWTRPLEWAQALKQSQVFMVSSLNHHISILKLTAHESYVDFLTTGDAPSSLPSDSGWCRPKLQRSKWFDLFDVHERLEAFRGLWGVMAYLTRDTGKG